MEKKDSAAPLGNVTGKRKRRTKTQISKKNGLEQQQKSSLLAIEPDNAKLTQNHNQESIELHKASLLEQDAGIQRAATMTNVQ